MYFRQLCLVSEQIYVIRAHINEFAPQQINQLQGAAAGGRQGHWKDPWKFRAVVQIKAGRSTMKE